MPLNTEQLLAALKSPDMLAEIEKFVVDHKLSATAQEVIAIAKMVCGVAETICPIIDKL